MARAQTVRPGIGDIDQVAFLHTILESSTEYSIVAMDLDGIVLAWNEGARRNYGYDVGEMVGLGSVHLLHAPEDIASGRAGGLLTTALDTGKAEGVFERVRKGGQRFTASVSVTLRCDAAGTPVGYVLISKDITEQQKLEAQLRRKHVELEEQNHRVEEANRLKSEFLANMSHELRTPLNGIIGFAEILHDERVGPIAPDHKEYLGDILDSARHLLGLINDVLDVAKIESGTMDFYPEPVDLDRLVGEVQGTLRPLTASKNIHLQVDVDPRLTAVVVDPAKLRQVLYNYLSNALKFTPDGGRVTLRVKPEGEDMLRVDVEDTGIGIREEDLNRLFVAFQQLDASTSKRHQGTGLGLALTRRIVESQGGRVAVRSVLGAGSTFSAVLPRVAAEAAVLLPDAVEEGIPDFLRKPVGPQALLAAVERAGVEPNDPRPVLLVDDDPNVGRLVAAALAARGLKILHVPSAEEGLRSAAAGCPCVVLLDLLMPGMSGFEFLDCFRRTEVGQRTPVIVWTVKDLSAGERAALCAKAPAIVWEDGATVAVLS